MKRMFRLALAGLGLAPVLALAQAPVAPYAYPAPRAARQATPMPLPTAPPSAMPSAAPAAVPAPVVDLPATGAAEPAEEEKKDEAKPEEKYFLEKLLASSPAGCLLSDGWKVYGWTQGSYTAGTTSRSTLPVPFVDRANDFSLNQNFLHVEKTIDTSKKEFQVGGTAEGIIPGSDARFTIARHLFDRQDRGRNDTPFDLFQAYADLYAPGVGPEGTTFRVGKFATFLEYETVQAITTPFVSRSYLFQYNPFTHTGGLAITPLNDSWTLTNGLAVGNDNFIGDTNHVAYLGQLKWAPKDGPTTVAFGTSVTDPRYDARHGFDRYNVYNLQVTHKIGCNLNYVFDGSYSHENNIPGVGSTNWYGMVHYLFYDHTEKLQSKARVELFEDTDGYRTGGAGLYTAATYGLTYKPTPWLWLTPEVRYDHHSRKPGPFESGDRDMFTATIGAIVRW